MGCTLALLLVNHRELDENAQYELVDGCVYVCVHACVRLSARASVRARMLDLHVWPHSGSNPL